MRAETLQHVGIWPSDQVNSTKNQLRGAGVAYNKMISVITARSELYYLGYQDAGLVTNLRGSWHQVVEFPLAA